MERITRLVEFETHDYMDMYPNKEVRAFKAESVEVITQKAILWAKAMNENYSGGTTTFKKVMSQMESIQFISKMITKTLEHPSVTRSSGDLDSTDVDYLKEVSSILEDLVRG